MTTDWRKSSRSGGATDEMCVEVARLPEGMGIRDSKNPAGGNLHLTGPEFAAFLQQIKTGALDHP